jgi:hypothetical protein
MSEWVSIANRQRHSKNNPVSNVIIMLHDIRVI